MKTNNFAFDLEKLPRELARTEVITDAKEDVERFGPMRQFAAKLSRRGLAGAKSELANHALALAVDLVLEQDADGWRPNLDADGRILVPLPWTRSGARHWGFRATEGRVFNLIMRQRSDREPQPLFVYDLELRGWLWGAWKRQTVGAYLRQNPITITEWRNAWNARASEWGRQHLGKELGLE